MNYFHKKKKSSLLKKMLWSVFILLASFIIVFLSFLTPFLLEMKSVYEELNQAKGLFEKGIVHIQNQNFNVAQRQFEEAEIIFQRNYLILQKYNKIDILNKYDYLKNNKFALTKLSLIGKNASQALASGALLADDLVDLYTLVENSQNTAVNNSDLKNKVSQLVLKAPPHISQIRSNLSVIEIALNQIPEKNVLDEFVQVKRKGLDQMANVKQIIEYGQELSHIVPVIIGYTEPKNYLFFLLNNDEIRPGGGFIGTYGIAQLANGKITEFKTDDIYNLDNNVSSDPNWPYNSPEPMYRYLGVEKLFLRDSNWSPDFTINAQKAIEMYTAQDPNPVQIDGVIAVTPQVIENTLDIFGDITFDGVTYNSSNLIDILQYKVEKEFALYGIPVSERKAVIGDLTKILMARILEADYSQALSFLQLLHQSLEEKDFLVYSTDQVLQQSLERQEWAGSISQNDDSDYLMVVDANLGSLKTDQVMDKQTFYSIEQKEDGRLYAKLTLVYKNLGDFTWKTTRYNSYTRVYVPRGSELVQTQGLDKERVALTNEFNKTVFGFDISIEPKSEKSYTLEYLLPDSVNNGKKYSLFLEKQVGAFRTFNIDGKFNHMIHSIKPSYMKNENMTFSSKLHLRKNTEVLVEFNEK